MPAMEVFSAAIKFLKDHLMKALLDRMYDIRDDDIKWVLTVPAIWDDPAKLFMREAAVMVSATFINLLFLKTSLI